MGPEGDLVHGKWIPVVDLDGGARDVGVLEVLAGAHEVRRLDLPAPSMLPVLLRQVLLPVVLDVLGAPRSGRDWGERFERGRLSPPEVEQVADYLGPRYGDRLRLLDRLRPFAQVAGLDAISGEVKPSTLLVPAIASGNNVPLFSGLTEADDLELTLPQAALWLLHAQCWDTAAIKTGAVGDPQAKAGKTTGNPTGALGQLGVIVPTGRTLYETLLLNIPVLPDGLDPADRPQWAASDGPLPAGVADPGSPRWSARPPLGLLDLLTFQSRRIRLIPVETDDGVRVRQVVICAGDRMTATSQTEPHTAWTHTTKPKAGRPAYRPRRHLSGRAAWQGMAALLALTLPEDSDGPYTSVLLRQIGDLNAEGWLPPDYPLGVTTCALEYGNQSAVVEHALADSIPLPIATLVAARDTVRAAVLECVAQADLVARALNYLHGDLRRAVGGDALPRDKGEHPSERLLHTVDRGMRRLLAGLRTVGDDADLLDKGQAAWEAVLRQAAVREAEGLLAAAPARATVGRTVKVNGKDVVYRAGAARARFYRTLDETLWRAAEASRAGEVTV